MMFDGHIHVMGHPGEKSDGPDEFQTKFSRAGMSGGVVISSPPATGMSAIDRLKDVFRWTRGNDDLYPFFWVDPPDPDALTHVDEAVQMGISGFKVICDRYYPSDPRPMEVFRRIARHRKPILFHSGILWDGTPSSKYNRPAEWECMLEIEGIRFSLAHISWPWVDEHVALYGKLEAARDRGRITGCEMFIDTTPGTPEIYRRDALVKVFGTGYDVANNVFFGVDSRTNAYGFQRARKLAETDTRIMMKMGIKKKVRDKYFVGNLKRFVRGSTE